MKRRDFLSKTGIIALGLATVPFISCNDVAKGEENKDNVPDQEKDSVVPVAAFTLPDLPYGYEALEPNIDTQTMTIHHSKHHAGYVKKLNKALEGHAYNGKNLEELMAMVKDQDGDIGVRNNGGGHFNHSLFWKIMKPGGGSMPSGKLADAINTQFGSYDEFKSQFASAAGTVFGSGWAWLAMDAEHKLFVTATPNQDNPLMSNLVEKGGTPILGIDVWEHAYYLKHQNKRKDYIDSFMELINWEQVAMNMEGKA